MLLQVERIFVFRGRIDRHLFTQSRLLSIVFFAYLVYLDGTGAAWKESRSRHVGPWVDSAPVEALPRKIAEGVGDYPPVPDSSVGDIGVYPRVCSILWERKDLGDVGRVYRSLNCSRMGL